MSEKGNNFRKQLREFYIKNREVINEHYQASEFPFKLLPVILKMNAGGFSRIPEKYGGNGSSFLDF